ncbi:MAG: N-acetylglucosamine-6-phosphate deacetylase [Proteobacteria bacterium]|nr:N-acetylglucosamine-6-phosphate deacetylase [Pseudomonadota bacterium]
MNPENGYIDLQVNGYAGLDFNRDDWNFDQLHEVCASLREHGVESIFATVISAPIDRMVGRLKRIVSAREGDSLVRDVIAGVHLEGPFLNAGHGYIGAHRPEWTTEADQDSVGLLLDAGQGLVRLWTLSPERDSAFAVTRQLADQGVVVSAGHCDSSLDQLRGAIDAGLSLFTHLGNGCPTLLPRHDNIIQRVLSLSDRLYISFIADGVHVPYPALGNYMQCVGMDRAIVITDAISAAGLGPGRYTLGERAVVVGNDFAGRYPGEDDHLAGSAITMKQSEANLKESLGLSEQDCRKVLSGNPRDLLGRG